MAGAGLADFHHGDYRRRWLFAANAYSLVAFSVDQEEVDFFHLFFIV